MREKPWHCLQQCLERHRIKILQVDRVVIKENRIKRVPRTSVVVDLQDWDTINQDRNTEASAGMKLDGQGWGKRSPAEDVRALRH